MTLHFEGGREATFVYSDLAAALKPVLPRTSAEAEAFLGAPVESWTDVAAPLQAHTIQPYSPLFTRIDPKLIDAMTDASKDTLAAAPAPAAPVKKAETKPAAPAEPKDATGTIGIGPRAGTAMARAVSEPLSSLRLQCVSQTGEASVSEGDVWWQGAGSAPDWFADAAWTPC